MGGPESGWRCLATLALVTVAGCSDGDEPTAEAPTPAPSSSVRPGPVDSDACRQAEQGASGPGPDVEGRAVDATLWALPFETAPFRAGQEVKIVWRMTGSGPPRFVVAGPDGVDPEAIRWGPEAHASSNWERPGDEWGTSIRFADPGCWQVAVRRDRGVGSVWFTVV